MFTALVLLAALAAPTPPGEASGGIYAAEGAVHQLAPEVCEWVGDDTYGQALDRVVPPLVTVLTLAYEVDSDDVRVLGGVVRGVVAGCAAA